MSVLTVPEAVTSTPPPALPAYARREVYRAGDSVPVLLDGVEVGRVPVSDVMP